jgi:hypothetical protein
VAFWLNYYSGSIKAALVITCALGIALIGLGGLSPVPGLLIATSCAVSFVGLLALLQHRINSKNLYPIRVVSHPQLGQVSVYRNSWQAQLQPFGLPYSCTLSGVVTADVPTHEQLSLWLAVCDRHQSLLEAAYRVLATNSSKPAFRPADFPLSLIQLQGFDTFMLFFTSRPSLNSKPSGFFVRYKDMAVIEAGRTPWKAKRERLEG